MTPAINQPEASSDLQPAAVLAMLGGRLRSGFRCTVGWLTVVDSARRGVPDERGLSQSTENAVLLTGAVGIAVTVIATVGSYVAKRLAELG